MRGAFQSYPPEHEYGSDEDKSNFLMEVMHSLHESWVKGNDPETEVAHRYPPHFAIVKNALLALYDIHRGRESEFLQMVRLGDGPMETECVVNTESVFYGSPDPDHLPNALGKVMKNVKRNISNLNRESATKSHWRGLRKPNHHMRTRSGGRA